MDLQGKQIVVFGGSGFIGKSIVQRLAKAGAIITVAVRHPSQGLFLKSMGEVGQITLMAVDFKKPSSLEAVLDGNEMVVNLIGQLFEKGNRTFTYAHTEIPKLIAQECIKQKINTFIHFSALGSDVHSNSFYARSKAQGEIEVSKIMTPTIFRPSVVFGPDDNFFNRFATMASLSPILPAFGGGHNKFQPVYVEDLSHAVLNVLTMPETQGKIYELGGPKVYTFKELMEKILKYCYRRRLVLPLPYMLGSMMGKVMEWLPTPPLTADQIKLLKTDNILKGEALSFQDLQIHPQSLETIVPPYLSRFKPHF
ncbi:MAG: complex I NDUFA9 subunit family protein [Janthinobacterium lividum]